MNNQLILPILTVKKKLRADTEGNDRRGTYYNGGKGNGYRSCCSCTCCCYGGYRSRNDPIVSHNDQGTHKDNISEINELIPINE